MCVSLVQKCVGPSVCYVVLNKHPGASTGTSKEKRQEEERKFFCFDLQVLDHHLTLASPGVQVMRGLMLGHKFSNTYKWKLGFMKIVTE